jgi:hypothetical protein
VVYFLYGMHRNAPRDGRVTCGPGAPTSPPAPVPAPEIVLPVLLPLPRTSETTGDP